MNAFIITLIAIVLLAFVVAAPVVRWLAQADDHRAEKRGPNYEDGE